ncbi:MAG: sodium:solute symporter [Acidobacteriota bacterium]
MGFTALDYGILLAYLGATSWLGLHLGRGQRDTWDYFLGGGRMPWWAVAGSIVATETSTLTFIGAPAIAYEGDLTFLTLTFGYCLGKILVAVLLIPLYFEGRVQTAYAVLRDRFGESVQRTAAGLFLLTRTLADGVRLFATALVLGVVTGLSDGWTIVLIGAVTLLYTSLGGMRAVVWNDVIQLAIYLTGAALAWWTLLDRIPGGWETVSSLAGEAGKFRIFDWTLDPGRPYTLAAGLLGGAFLTFATHGADQMMVQRYLACGERRPSQVALVASGIVVSLQFLVFLVLGVLLYCFYQLHPPAEPFTQVNRVFPTFIVQELPAGISGLIIAAIFAAAMSTLSSSLNSLAASTVNDFYRPLLCRGRDEDHYLRASRWITAGWAAVLVLVSFWARQWGELLQAGLTIAGLTMGSLLAVFLLGLARRRAGSAGVTLGMLGGLLTVMAVHWSGEVAWTWYVLIGTVASLAGTGLVEGVRGGRS